MARKTTRKTTRKTARRAAEEPATGDLGRLDDDDPKPAEEPLEAPLGPPIEAPDPGPQKPPKRADRGDEPTVPGRPVRTLDRLSCARDRVVDAVRLEGLDRGLAPRWALAHAEAIADRLRLDNEEGDAPSSGFFDLRGEQDYVYPGDANKVRKHGLSVVMRDPSTITTIVVHQTACEFGVSNHAIKAAGDVELARARRALDVAAHVVAFRHGYFVAAHPLRAYVNHAGRFNATSLGYEIEGRYAGIVDDPSTVAREDLQTTWGGKPTVLDDDTIAAACAGLRWLVDEARAEGMPIKYVVSHRQSSDARRSDPGEEIWRRIVLGFAVDSLGLEPQRESRWQQGRPVPVQWDPDGIGDY